LNAGAFLHPVRITLASAASQAVGPPTSDLEMSFGGRRGADLGRKMLSTNLKPLALQVVSTTDGVLGSLSLQAKKKAAPGISTTYLALVQAAFLPQWWDGGKWNVDLSTGSPVLRSSGTTGPNVFTVAEYNFSLFFGLAIREYEATLVADQTPFDRFMEGDNAALSPAAVRGLQTFLGKASCVRCHGGPELSNAGVTSIQRRGLLVEPGVGTHDLLERMVMGDGGVAVYDAGHYNIGVRDNAAHNFLSRLCHFVAFLKRHMPRHIDRHIDKNPVPDVSHARAGDVTDPGNLLNGFGKLFGQSLRRSVQ